MGFNSGFKGLTAKQQLAHFTTLRLSNSAWTGFMELTKINFHQTQGTQWKCQKVKLFTELEGDVKTKTQEDSTTSRHTLRCHALNMNKSRQYVQKGSVSKGQRVWLARRLLTFRFIMLTNKHVKF